MSNTEALLRLFTSYGNAMYRNDPDAAEQIAQKFSAALAQPAASGEPVAYLVRDVNGERGTGMLVRACNIGSYQRATLEREPLYTARPAPARVPLTDEQVHAMWVNATIERTDMGSVYVRGLRDGEAAHGITAKEAP